MVGHQAIGQQPSFGPLDRLNEYALESFVVRIAAKDRHPGVGPVEDVVDVPSFSGSMRASHVRNLTNRKAKVKKKVPDTFFGP